MKKHEPTAELQKKALALAQRGVPHDLIALSLGVAESTLEKHYKEQLDAGRAHCVSNLLTMAFERAKKSDAILIFLLKTKAGLRETGPTQGEAAKAAKTVTFRVTGRGERISIERDEDEGDDD